jgi:hypothetical protein
MKNLKDLAYLVTLLIRAIPFDRALAGHSVHGITTCLTGVWRMASSYPTSICKYKTVRLRETTIVV